MVLVYILCLFTCQISSVRSDGISLPITSLSYTSSPADQKTLSVSFTPNVCTETPTSYIPTGVRLTESANVASIVSQDPSVVQKLLPQSELLIAPKLPFKTVTMPAPIITSTEPYLQTLETPLKIRSLNPNIAITPQITTFPAVNLCNVENYNLPSNDCTQKLTPPIVQAIPAYFVTSKDSFYGNTKTPTATIMLDNLPNNVYKMKVIDLKPIIIDCSKPTNYYKTPATLTTVKPIEINNLEKLHNPPILQVIPNLKVDNPNKLREEFVIPQAPPVKIVQENPIIPPRSKNVLNNEQCTKTISSNEQITNPESPASTGKVIYPITNVKFNYGSNIFNPFLKACNEKTQSCTVNPPKLLPADNQIGLTVQPTVNIVDNDFKSTQCNIKASDNFYCNCNNVNTLSKLDPASYCTKSSTPSYTFNQDNSPRKELPIIPITQLPNVNTINIPTLSSPIQSTSTLETAYDIVASRLSCSLNSIISLLTEGLMSKIFGNKSPEKSLADIVPKETLSDTIAFRSPVTETPYVLSPPLVTCPSPIEFSAISPKPLIDIELKETYSHGDLKVPPILCAANAPKRKPYLASVTINIIPNTEPSHDIIIIV